MTGNLQSDVYNTLFVPIRETLQRQILYEDLTFFGNENKNSIISRMKKERESREEIFPRDFVKRYRQEQ